MKYSPEEKIHYRGCTLLSDSDRSKGAQTLAETLTP